MKQLFTYTYYIRKAFRFLLLVLVLLIALPAIETTQVEAQTTKKGNFFTKRFKRKNKFNRKSKNKTAFQRKPFSCGDIGKQKVEQIKVSKKQLRRWEEERLVGMEQERLKEERQAKTQNSKSSTIEEKVIFSASSENNLEEVAIKKNSFIEKKTSNKTEKQKEENKEEKGWYSSEKADAPKISPILINQKNEITQRSKKELEIAAKYSRLGYFIVLESKYEKQSEKIREYLISIGTDNETIRIQSSEQLNQNEVIIKIEK